MTRVKLRERATCAECGYQIDLRRDGNVGQHHRWISREYRGVCLGTGKPPRTKPQR